MMLPLVMTLTLRVLLLVFSVGVSLSTEQVVVDKEQQSAQQPMDVYANPYSRQFTVIDQAAQFHQQALNLANREQYDLSLAYFRLAVRYAPRNAHYWSDLGVTEMRTKDFRRSFRRFQRALSIDPGFQLAKKNIDELIAFAQQSSQLSSQISMEELLDWSSVVDTIRIPLPSALSDTEEETHSSFAHYQHNVTAPRILSRHSFMRILYPNRYRQAFQLWKKKKRTMSNPSSTNKNVTMTSSSTLSLTQQFARAFNAIRFNDVHRLWQSLDDVIESSTRFTSEQRELFHEPFVVRDFVWREEQEEQEQEGVDDRAICEEVQKTEEIAKGPTDVRDSEEGIPDGEDILSTCHTGREAQESAESTQTPAWTSLGQFSWTASTLSAIYPTQRVDFYPHNMYEEQVGPVMTSLSKAMRQVMTNLPDEALYPSSVDVSETGSYLQWNLDEFLFQDLLTRSKLSLPRFMDTIEEDHNFQNCLWTSEMKSQYFLATHWKMLLIGNENAGMFFHQDTLQASAWQIHLQGRKQWHICPGFQERRSEAQDQDEMEDEEEEKEEDLFYYKAGQTNMFSPNYVRFPLLRERSCHEFVMNPGDFMYYPGHYWHQTRNLVTPTMSLTSSMLLSKRDFRVVSRELAKECRGAGRVFPRDAEMCRRLQMCFQEWTAATSSSAQSTNLNER